MPKNLLRPYRAALAQPGVARLVIAQLAAYLLSGMAGLSLMLSAERASGSYATAGAVSAGYAVALAAAAPVWGTLADSRGPRPVLLATVLAQSSGFAAYTAAVITDASSWLLLGCAMAAGAATPPVSAICRRIMMDQPVEAHRRALFSLSGLFAETVFVVGPLLVGVVVLVGPPVNAVVATGVISAASVLWLRMVPAVKTVARVRRTRGPMRFSARQAELYGVVALGAFAIGGLQVTVIAYADDLSLSAGVLIGCVAAGGTVSSLAYGAWRLPGSLAAHLGTALSLYGLAILLLTLQPAAAAGISILLLIGLCTGPADAIEALILGAHTPVSQQAQAFSLLVTANWIGFAAGSAATGAIIEHLSPAGGPLAAASAALGAAALTMTSGLRTTV
ncbi:MFS transporter [Saccharothrix sp. AJ9571]|nr:MFS transporter [Saccharothrix sp. AJ9571]